MIKKLSKFLNIIVVCLVLVAIHVISVAHAESGTVRTLPTSGGGSGSGSWSTTTSQVLGRLVNYPNNNTDIVNIGSNSTTTGKFWFDPNVSLASFLGNLNFQFASGTALTLSGSAYLPKLGNLTTNGFVKTSGGDGTLGVDTNTYLTGSGAGVTAVSVASSNGFAGSSSGGATPALTLTTTINSAVLKGNGTAISGAVNGTDYSLITALDCTGTGHLLKVTAAGVFTCSADSGGTGTSAFEIATTSDIAQSQIAYISKTSGRTTLASTATTTLTASAPFSLSQPISVIGSSASVLTAVSASAGVTGFLTGTDWSTFNNKQATISVTTPITLTGASVGIVNQGTTAQVLHGNASGNASFGAIVNADITNSTIDLTTKVTGVLPIANGGTATSTQVANGVNYFDGTRITSGTSLTYDGTKMGVGSSTPIAQVSVNSTAGVDPLVVGSSTKSLFGVTQGGVITLSETLPATTTTITYDWANTPPLVTYQMGTSAFTITMINATTSRYTGSRKMIEVCNPGAVAGAITWKGVEWYGGTQPSQTTTANACDTWSFFVGSATSTTAFKVHGAVSSNFQ